jgi:UDP-3-O-[3-hydroxymyristoyl] glucosamine N-acyltransferase
MPDPRFYLNRGPLPLADLVAAVGGEVAPGQRADLLVSAAAPLDRAGPGDIAFLGDRKYLPALRETRAGAVLVSEPFVSDVPKGCIAVVARRPHAAWSAAAGLLHAPRGYEPGAPAIHPTAVIEDGVQISPGVVIGPDARIGRGTRLDPNVVIGPGVAIGRDCTIGANASVLFALVGDRVQIYAGSRVGEAGFGATGGEAGVIDVPQLGRVILQDGVTLGANSCIDRGAWEDTVVGENSKLDNLTHIGHSARLGRNCVMAAYSGLSGTVTVGDGVAMGGRVGIADHVDIGAGARLGAGSGVFRHVPAGETWGGFPAQPMKAWLRQTAWLAKSTRPTKEDKA